MFEIEIQMLPFLMLFSAGIALFHTLILEAFFGLRVKPGWILYLIHPLIIVAGYFLFPQQAGIIFIVLFASVFVLAILGFIKKGIQGAIESFNTAREKKKPLWKIILSTFGILFIYVAFFYFGTYSFFIIIFIIILTSVLPNHQNRFYFYQRNLSTSKIKSVAVGLAEICGKAKAITPSVSPYTSTPCVGYIYTIDEIIERRDGEGRTSKSYRQVQKEVNIKDFILTDDSGSIEVQAENLDWISFSPVFERETGSERYREYILDEKTEILMIGQAFYEGAKTIFRYDDNKKLFGMAPYEMGSFANKWRPLKLRAVATILCISVISALIFLTPVKIQGSKLIFEPFHIIKNLSKNPFDFFK
jgi:hypothetical protein